MVIAGSGLYKQMKNFREQKHNSDLNSYRITTSSSSSKNCVAFLQFFGLLLAETQLASRLQFLQFLQRHCRHVWVAPQLRGSRGRRQQRICCWRHWKTRASSPGYFVLLLIQCRDLDAQLLQCWRRDVRMPATLASSRQHEGQSSPLATCQQLSLPR